MTLSVGLFRGKFAEIYLHQCAQAYGVQGWDIGGLMNLRDRFQLLVWFPCWV